MSIKRRVERLEERPPARGDIGDLPDLVIHWPEEETAETRAGQRRVKEAWAAAGVDLASAALVVSWADGSEVTPP